ncbi:MAG: hypothetical protein AAFR61_13280 [Bacteroidota bacterium]
MNQRFRQFIRQLFIAASTQQTSAKGPEKNRGLVILLFALMSMILWGIVTLNRDYNTTLSLIATLPEGAKVEGAETPRLMVDVHGYGMDLLGAHLRLRNDTVPLSFDPEALTKGYLELALHKDDVARILPKEFEIRRLHPDRFYLNLQNQVQKRVPVIWNTYLDLPPTFQLEFPPQLITDSVVITGPAAVLDTLDSWPTAPVKLMVSEAQTLSVPLMDTIIGIHANVKNVQVFVKPMKFTEVEITTRISITNMPDSVDVRLDSREIAYTCLVPLEKYEEIFHQIQEDVIAIPFTDLNLDSPFIIPNPDFPDEVKIITRNPIRVGFVLVRKTLLSLNKDE